MVYGVSGVVAEWSVRWVWCVRALLMKIVMRMSIPMINAGAWLLLLKSGKSLLDCLRAYLLEYFEAKSSIIFFYCCLDSWTVLLSPIIVLATVVSLYIPFAPSSDRLIFTCIF
jgi:hypothetical protein